MTNLNVLPTRARNALRAIGIQELDDIAGWPDARLLKVPNIGRHSIIEIRRVAAMSGVTNERQPISDAQVDAVASYWVQAIVNHRAYGTGPEPALLDKSRVFRAVADRLRAVANEIAPASKRGAA